MLGKTSPKKRLCTSFQEAIWFVSSSASRVISSWIYIQSNHFNSIAILTVKRTEAPISHIHRLTLWRRLPFPYDLQTPHPSQWSHRLEIMHTSKAELLIGTRGKRKKLFDQGTLDKQHCSYTSLTFLESSIISPAFFPNIFFLSISSSSFLRSTLQDIGSKFGSDARC
jgi:hypothetical protein